MFRRNGKAPDEPAPTSPYRYGANNEIPPRIFDTPSPNVDEMPRVPHPFPSMMKEDAPETTLGEGVIFRGELSFERLLKIDGTFEGQLLSQGKVIVGPSGKVKANLNLREAIIEGKVEGNITVQERLELRGEAVIVGDIRAKTLTVDEGVTLLGHVRIDPKEEVASLSTL